MSWLMRGDRLEASCFPCFVGAGADGGGEERLGGCAPEDEIRTVALRPSGPGSAPRSTMEWRVTSGRSPWSKVGWRRPTLVCASHSSDRTGGRLARVLDPRSLARTGLRVSQRELAERLGMKQPQVARLELGEVNPSMETLMRVSAQLGIEFTIDVRPAGTPVHNVTKRAQAHSLVSSLRTDEAEILVAARYEAHFCLTRLKQLRRSRDRSAPGRVTSGSRPAWLRYAGAAVFVRRT